MFNFLQELAASDDVAPYICGAVVGDAPLFPGETTRLTLTVDEDICDDRAVFTLVGMLSEYICSPKGSVAYSQRFQLL